VRIVSCEGLNLRSFSYSFIYLFLNKTDQYFFQACTNLVEILKSHGYYKVKEMPPEFVNACGNLYPYFCYFLTFSCQRSFSLHLFTNFIVLPIFISHLVQVSPIFTKFSCIFLFPHFSFEIMYIFIVQMFFWTR
jgi:hypothetical protein